MPVEHTGALQTEGTPARLQLQRSTNIPALYPGPCTRAEKSRVSRTVISPMWLSLWGTYSDVRSGTNSLNVCPLYVMSPENCGTTDSHMREEDSQAPRDNGKKSPTVFLSGIFCGLCQPLSEEAAKCPCNRADKRAPAEGRTHARTRTHLKVIVDGARQGLHERRLAAPRRAEEQGQPASGRGPGERQSRQGPGELPHHCQAFQQGLHCS